MKKRMEKVNKDKVHYGVEEELLQTADDYQCSGHLDVDFPELCALFGLKEIPDVRPVTAASPTERALDSNREQSIADRCMKAWSPKPCLHIETENEDSRSVKRVRISGWRVYEVMARVLSKTLPSLINLRSLEMWQVGLTDSVLASLKDTVCLCSKLRRVILDGTPIPGSPYHILLGEDSMITHLSLRHNRIGEEGARLIGLALSKNLLSLNLAFNAVGDVGAMYLAQTLRLNRNLLYLSLANNHISDVGAAHLAQVFGPFALTHEEIVERRRLLKRKDRLSAQLISEVSKCESALSIPSSSSLEYIKSAKKKDSSKKDEKTPISQTTTGKKEDPKVDKKRTSDTKMTQGRGGKSDGKDKLVSMKEQETEEVAETQSPLLNPAIQNIGGRVIHPGNTTLLSLNLSGNKLTQKSLQSFLSSVECQGQSGLQYISLNRNCFPPDCEVFLKLQEMMSLKDPLNRTNSAQVEAEQGKAS